MTDRPVPGTCRFLFSSRYTRPSRVAKLRILASSAAPKRADATADPKTAELPKVARRCFRFWGTTVKVEQALLLFFSRHHGLSSQERKDETTFHVHRIRPTVALILLVAETRSAAGPSAGGGVDPRVSKLRRVAQIDVSVEYCPPDSPAQALTLFVGDLNVSVPLPSHYPSCEVRSSDAWAYRQCAMISASPSLLTVDASASHHAGRDAMPSDGTACCQRSRRSGPAARDPGIKKADPPFGSSAILRPSWHRTQRADTEKARTHSFAPPAFAGFALLPR